MPNYPSFTPTYHHDVYPAIDPTQPALDCRSKIVLITGGGRGIGKAISHAFARANAFGIALLGRSQSSLDETAQEIAKLSSGKTKTFVYSTDITDPASIQTALDKTIAHFDGRVPDVLVNNAGAVSGVGALIDVDLAEFWHSFEVNVKGPLAVTQALLRANRVHDSADTSRTVINVSSAAAHVPYAPTLASYSVAKLAAAKIAEYVQHETPSWRVFNMQPGVVATDMSRGVGRAAEDQAELPAGFAVWLATQKEADVLRGRFVWANWDVEELLQRGEEIVEQDLLTITSKGWSDGVSDGELKKRAQGLHRNADRK